MMEIRAEQIRNYRLRAHHLDRKLPADGLLEAAGACGLQNSPPGAWETAAFQRLEGCTLGLLQDALYRDRRLLQAWSFRGAPVVFPTDQSGVFLSALAAREGEQPWIYTMGIAGALDFLQMSFEDLLLRLKKAIAYLDSHTVRSKEALDQVLADLIEQDLPLDKRPLWRAPSMYGSPDRQTVGGGAVSFLLRPCSFASLVVFGQRQGTAPSFTSFRNWTGHDPEPWPDGEKELVRRFLRCYGPSTRDFFMSWLGCSRPQARRLWEAAGEEMEPVSMGKKTAYVLSADRWDLLNSAADEDRLLLLGPHDPYLDGRDHALLLEDPALQRAVWKTVGNPGVILRGGRIAGIWRSKTQKGKLDLSMTLFEALSPAQRKILQDQAEEYAAFRLLRLNSCIFEG